MVTAANATRNSSQEETELMTSFSVSSVASCKTDWSGLLVARQFQIFANNSLGIFVGIVR
jgi:hypothetical protein